MNRRQHLLTLAALATTGCTTSATTSATNLVQAVERRVQRIGLQLYTVRDLMAEDAAATLAKLAAIGYTELETAGYGNLDANGFAKAAAQNGLTPVAAHVPINLLVDAPTQLLDEAEMIGFDYLVVPWLPPELRNADGYKQVIDQLNRFGALSAARNIQLCYHNHDFEFADLGGMRAFDLMLKDCDAELVKFELDMFWTEHAGVDTAAYLRADPDRYPLCHVKDRTSGGAMADVGSGEIDFGQLFAAGSGLRHYFVEHDRPADSLQSVTASFQGLAGVRF